MEEDMAREPKEKRIKKWRILVGVVLLVGTVMGGLTIWWLKRPESLLPPTLAQQITFPIYLPDQLPGAYHITKNSFSYSNGVLIFKAEDTTGNAIAFTEQQKPKDFNFATFYSQQLSDAKNIDRVPFSSTMGKALQGKNTVLSVVTDRTWLLISSQAPLTQEDMTKIAQSLQRR